MKIENTTIPGLLVIQLDVHGDERGWFKENWQRQKLVEIGLPDFGPVQNNISFNAQAGVTRGLHAEPWDKFISVATGSVFGAWCDLRDNSETFGKTFTTRITPDTAVYVPRGVANGFQALEDGTAYTYLVNDHWSPDAQYYFVNLDMIDWPLEPTEISEKDLHHPQLEQATPVPPKRILVTGANGQLGRSLRQYFPDADFCSRDKFDITNPPEFNWSDYSVIINAAAYTQVDAAEADRSTCWAVNAFGPAKLANIARDNNITLVHVSTDYVFDGSAKLHTELEPLSPLGAYGASKAAGDIAVTQTPRHYLLRTSWVVGDGKNFVRTMRDLARKGVKPEVVDDQFGRLAFSDEIARAINHLLNVEATYGTYNISNSGDIASWCDVAKEVYTLAGFDPDWVSPVSTEDYFRNKTHAPRPVHSGFELTKLEATGFHPADWRGQLASYLSRED